MGWNIGASQSGGWDIGASQDQGGSGPVYDAVLKRYNGSSWVAVDLKRYTTSWESMLLKKYISSSWQSIDTTGT